MTSRERAAQRIAEAKSTKVRPPVCKGGHDFEKVGDEGLRHRPCSAGLGSVLRCKRCELTRVI